MTPDGAIVAYTSEGGQLFRIDDAHGVAALIAEGGLSSEASALATLPKGTKGSDGGELPSSRIIALITLASGEATFLVMLEVRKGDVAPLVRLDRPMLNAGIAFGPGPTL